jgi:carbon-monoxide dehydrogenase medium subunit
MWTHYANLTELDEALAGLERFGKRARIMAGGTDLILELERGQRPGVEALLDVTRIPGLNTIREEAGRVHLGPLVTHNQCVASALVREKALPLALACWEVGAPQIRNRGTIAGNLITASPANDTISALMALEAHVTLRSVEGERDVPLIDFITGVRKTVMRADEMLVDIHFAALDAVSERGTFYKLGLRRAQAISIVHVGVVVKFEGETIRQARIALGSVAPTITRASAAESFLKGKTLSDAVIAEAGELAKKAASPIDDVRSSAAYRDQMVATSVRRALGQVAKNEQGARLPGDPVLLWGETAADFVPELREAQMVEGNTVIETTINGKAATFHSGQDKTLLRLLREDGLLIGTKEGCMEGECGACTVFLDGHAVMSCLVAAPRAHGAMLETIEGLAAHGKLHPVQQAFIDHAAVQCGYCTPGLIMSAAKLLQEKPHPSRAEAAMAITGNLCRCTGYYKILDAIEDAGRQSA